MCPVSEGMERVGNGQVGPGRVRQASARTTAEAQIPRQIAALIDPVAFGVSLAIVCGSMLLLATIVLVLKGGQQVGSHLVLLSHYFPGYRVTPVGSLIGGFYAAAGAFLFGWLTAHLRNVLLRIYLWMVRFRANLSGSYFLDRFD